MKFSDYLIIGSALIVLVGCILYNLVFKDLLTVEDVGGAEGRVFIEENIPQEDIVVTPIIAETKEEEPQVEKIKYNYSFKNSVKDYLSTFSHISVKQSRKTNVKGVFNGADSFYDIECDLTNKRYFIGTSSDGENIEHQYYNDAINEVIYERSSSGEWVVPEDEFPIIDADFTTYNNAYDFYNFSISDMVVDSNVESVLDGEQMSFVYECDAKSTDLLDTEYDSLGKKKTSMIFNKTLSGWLPYSATVIVEYTVGEVEYETSISLVFSDISNVAIDGVSSLKQEQEKKEAVIGYADENSLPDSIKANDNIEVETEEE